MKKVGFWKVVVAFGVLVSAAHGQGTFVSNTTYASGQTLTVTDPSLIQAGTSVIVASGATVSYQAVSSVTLLPGFDAKPGSTFTAATYYPGGSANVAQAPVSSSSAAVPYGQPFLPSIVGGSGTGGWQFYVVNNTSWALGPGDPSGTLLSNGQWSTTWTAPKGGVYQFYVARNGDSTYGSSNYAGPYTLTVGMIAQNPLTSTNVSIPYGSTFLPPFIGGSGAGNWQFMIVGQTNWDPSLSNYYGTNTGTNPGDAPGANWVTHWTPPAPGTYMFGVSRGSDGTYDAASSEGYILSVYPTLSSTAQQLRGSSVAATVGSSITFSVAQGPQGSFTYQWMIDGMPIAGATSSSYTISSASLASDGTYDCEMSGAEGAVFSNADALVVVAGLPAPTFSPAAGTYTGEQIVTIADSEASTIYYTTDGTTPTTSSAVYSGPIPLSSSTTLQAGGGNGSGIGPVASATYTITPAAATPTISITGSAYGGEPFTYLDSATVTLTSATANATIRYTTDGTAPSETNGYTYSGPITIGQTAIISAIAYESGLEDSGMATGLVAIAMPVVVMPTFTQTGSLYEGIPGTYAGPVTVAIASATPNAYIRYTTDGSTPSETQGILYTGPFVITGSETPIRAIAYESGDSDSGVATEDVGIVVPFAGTPTITTSGTIYAGQTGTYLQSATVTLASSTPGATIRYTTDGSTPSETNGEIYTGPITMVQGTTNVAAIAYEPGYLDSGITTVTVSVVVPIVATPTIAPSGTLYEGMAGSYNGFATVTLASATPGATIRYTTDDSTPSETNGTIYTGPFTVGVSQAVVRAIAYEAGDIDSYVATTTIGIVEPVVDAPTFASSGVPYKNQPYTYIQSATVSIACATPGASIRYTTDGSLPTETYGTLYTGPVSITQPETTFYAIAYEQYCIDSSIAVMTIAVTAGAPSETPSITLSGAEYQNSPSIFTESATVSIASYPPGSTTRYTTDGSLPTETNGIIYSVPFVVDQSTIIQAITYGAPGYADSTVGYANPIIVVPAPTFILAPGTYAGPQMATLICQQYGEALYGETIYYTTDGSQPSSSSTLYTGTIPISSTTTVRAIGYNASGLSAVVSATYTIVPPVAPPAFNYATGVYGGPLSVTIASATPGATIRYTTDGTAPSETHGILYGGAVSITSSATLNAIAYESGDTDSTVTTATYAIQSFPGAPVFTPAAGTYDSQQTVAISCSLATTIYYTTDGSTPTASSPVYNGPIAVPATETIQALGINGSGSGSVTSATYTISAVAVAPVISPSGVSYNNEPDVYVGMTTVAIASTTANATVRYTTDGSIPGDSSGTIYTGPVNIDAATTFRAIAYKQGDLDSPVSMTTVGIVAAPAAVVAPFIQTAGTTYDNFTDDYINSATVIISSPTPGAVIRYTTDNTIPTENHGTIYTGPFVMDQDGIVNAMAYEEGYSDSGNGSLAVSIMVSAPTMSPAPGVYAGAQLVTISNQSGGANAIYYTTDGSQPSTSSTPYAGSISVSATTTIRAIASGLFGEISQVTSATYTIPVAMQTPAFSLAAGVYPGAVSVTISSASTGASIRYTIDGTTPSETNGTLYTGPVNIASSTTVNAIAYQAGNIDSAVATSTYTIQSPPVAPFFSPAPGAYGSSQTVTITSSGSTAIYYTTDGTTPTSSSNVYAGPLSVGSNTTILAVASNSLGLSPVSTGVYTISPVVGTPVFSASGASGANVLVVAITSATPNCTIRYTTDGSTPSESNGTTYSGPITLTAPVTLSAMAFASGHTDSPVIVANVGVAAVSILSPVNGSTIGD